MPENYTPKLLDLDNEIVLFEGDIDTLTYNESRKFYTAEASLNVETMANYEYTVFYVATGKNYLIDDITDEDAEKADVLIESLYSKMGLIKDDIFIPLYVSSGGRSYADNSDPASANIAISFGSGATLNFTYISYTNDAPFHLKLGFSLNVPIPSQEFTSFGGDKLFDLNNEKVVEKLKEKINTDVESDVEMPLHLLNINGSVTIDGKAVDISKLTSAYKGNESNFIIRYDNHPVVQFTIDKNHIKGYYETINFDTQTVYFDSFDLYYLTEWMSSMATEDPPYFYYTLSEYTPSSGGGTAQ